ncbi:VanZ family protein [Tardiphaga sp. vice352]|uniref:VanZ family protein n=1 Tax=unclassified Tardiphaga TaxID=2631404 RepID=UPI0011636707|nr:MULTISPECIES: VanZ family protein [unclassified Tardiphaga]QDM18923.1 VanZ family protein [Tardiphaga sp. vice278]QDM23908.1 VanZ family protein [Tardiphaga sp. vice154]QDM29129.1 VanZ family protein [Tardiphaga sp. vice304]QDM34229.1 VanZ family protein [Tardiphaga sp. vice352]
MSRKIFTAIAWAVLASIVFVTLSPIGWRPHFEAVSLERAGAFAVVGLLFGLAYPDRLWRVLSLMAAAALLLEALQHLTPDRHGRLSDAVVKILGAITGVGIAWLCTRAHAAFAPVARKR